MLGRSSFLVVNIAIISYAAARMSALCPHKAGAFLIISFFFLVRDKYSKQITQKAIPMSNSIVGDQALLLLVSHVPGASPFVSLF